MSEGGQPGECISAIPSPALNFTGQFTSINPLANQRHQRRRHGLNLQLRGDLDTHPKKLRALFRKGGGSVVGFCVRHIDSSPYLFIARGWRMTIHHSRPLKRQEKVTASAKICNRRRGR
jgi:hypothetical protein